MTDTTKQIEQDEEDAMIDLRKAVFEGASDEWIIGFIRQYPLAARATPVSAGQTSQQLTEDAEALVGIAGHLREVKHWAAQASVRELAEMAKRFLAAANTAPAKSQSDLHSAIMNLPDNIIAHPDIVAAYKRGHRKARHAAAELVAAAQMDQLTAGQERTVQWFLDAIAWHAEHKDESTLSRIKTGLCEVVAASVGAQVADRVQVPTNAEQAAGMVLLGTNWLQSYAPEMLRAQVAGEPVAWMMKWDNHAPSLTTDPTDYLPHERKSLIPLYTAPVPAPQDQIATAIHYPACWDTTAYPTLESALAEMYGFFKCSECAPVPVPATVPNSAIQALEQAADVCGRIYQDHRDQYKGRGKYSADNPRRADSHCDGCADGAAECEEAIRSLILKAAPAAQAAVPEVVREAVEAAFEERDGWRAKVAQAVRALVDVPQGVEAQKGQQ